MQNIIMLIILIFLAGLWQSNNSIVPAPQDELPQDFTVTIIPDSSVAMLVQNENLDNKLYAWGFKRIKGKAPSIPKNITDMLNRYDGYYLGNTNEKVLYLTFDEGYENGYTEQILDVLKKNNVPAAFFVTGPYLEKGNSINTKNGG